MPLISLVFSVRIVNYGSSFCSIDLWPKREKIDGKKRGSAIYNTDQKNEANKMFIIWLLPVSETGNKCRTRDLTVI